jgi:tRNA-2-methylthio-N6-dimethylallyladenosine synthase
MTKKYHFWISGCQMNYADARQVANKLEGAGYRPTDQAEDADVIILQTCTVRQQAEDKAIGRLSSLRPLKERNPDLTLAMMGCVVGVKGNNYLAEKFPFVDLWMPPASDGYALLAHLQQGEDQTFEVDATEQRFIIQDEEMALPLNQRRNLVSAPVSVVYGCSHACTFCIIPHKRGIERTRPVGTIVSEVRSLVLEGVKEVVLLGQIVDRYGKDIPDGPDLADLLEKVHEIEGIQRIRFLTSHPNYMTDRILLAVAKLPKVMPQIEVPIQAGDDDILRAMNRGYTADQYRDLVKRIRHLVPEASIHNDVIVGFPGESKEQFQKTLEIIAELELDKVHIARYSPRPGTVSTRRMDDDVPDPEKRRRFHALEELQKGISERKNARWLGKDVEILVEDQHKGRWRGRSPQGKLVFFDDPRELRGELVNVQITYTGPWSMSGITADGLDIKPVSESINLPVF